jgi:integrase
MPKEPRPAIVVREHNGLPFYEAKFRFYGRQIKRRIGPAWLTRDSDVSDWRKKRGRVPDGAFDEHDAHVAAAQIVKDYVTRAAEVERVERERRIQGVTFREVARGYLDWLEKVRGAKPATMADYRSVLGEPGVPLKRGEGVTAGRVMEALGDRSATQITVREVEQLLAAVAKSGASPRTVNKYRSIVSGVFAYGAKSSTFNLPANPARETDKRGESEQGALRYYSVKQVEALAETLAASLHRASTEDKLTPETVAAMRAEDKQDAEAVRVSAYVGLRLGELLALRWRDVDFAGKVLTVARAMSAGVESSPKSGKVRRVPLPDPAAAALTRLRERGDFTDPGALVFCNPFGRHLDGSALRRRYRRAQEVAGLDPLRWHDLRHTYGSLLASKGVDLVAIQSAMGHSVIATTSRYLHARPAGELAQTFSAAFERAAA